MCVHRSVLDWGTVRIKRGKVFPLNVQAVWALGSQTDTHFLYLNSKSVERKIQSTTEESRISFITSKLARECGCLICSLTLGLGKACGAQCVQAPYG